MSRFTKEHLEEALTWIERNVHDGIRIVAGALSATYPEDDEAAPPAAPPTGVQDIASVKAGEINAQFPETDVLVLVVDDGVMRVGACLSEQSPERIKEILTNALALLEKQP